LDWVCGITFQLYFAEERFEVFAVDHWLTVLERVADLKNQSGLTNLKCIQNNHLTTHILMTLMYLYN
jgi:hypothetical protein